MAKYSFRGKSPDSGWVYGDLIRLRNGNRIHVIRTDNRSKKDYNIVSNSIGMRSGLTDKNRTEVFEGDIIEYSDCIGHFVGVVRFGRHNTTDGHTYIGFFVDWGKWPGTEYIRNDLVYWIEQAGAVVIGDVFGNPELLRGKEESDNG